MSKTNYDDAIKQSIDYFNGDELAASVYINKYAINIDGDYIEPTPEKMHERLSKEYTRMEDLFGGPNKLSKNAIHELFDRFKYIVPAGSVMSGLGNENYIGSLSNCFVIGSPSDSYASIMRYREFQIQLMKRRGGVGKDISNLRPSGSAVNNAAKSSTGPVSFMDVDSELTKEVAQGGRRGALMLSISCLHPDSDQFILKKQDSTKVNGANISVQFTDEFMECVEKDTTFVQRFPIGTDITELDLDKLPLNEKVWDGDKCYKLIKATDLWNSFVHCSWNKAEPGAMFCDKHWEFSPDSVYPQYKGVTTNPCGEIFMGPYDSCRLMHINLSSFVENPFTPNAKLDEKGLYEVAYMNMQLCDDLVELELEHVSDIIEHIKSTYNDDVATELSLWEKVYETGKSSRRAGCGATSLGDVLAMLGLGMNTEEGLRMVDTIAKTKMIAEIQAQVDLARERGTFVGYDFDKEFGYDEEKGVYYGKNGFFQRVIDMGIPEDLILEMKKYGRRNVSWSTMAPVGSASLMTQTTSGIEPLFSPFYKRRKKCGDSNDRVDFIDKTGEKFTEFYVLHGKFKEWIMEHSGEYDHTLSFDEQMNDDKLNYLFSKSPWYGSTAAELSTENHVLVQSIFQYYTTHSISKTINLPKNVTEDVVSDLFMKAWKLSLKGLTVYRDGCRDGILVKDDKDCDCKTSLTHSSPKRPKSMPCEIKRFRNGGEKWIAAVGLYNGKPYEIFTGLSEKLDIPEYVKEAEIIKNYVVKMIPDEDTEEMVEKKVSRYDIKYITNDNKSVTVDGISNVFNPEYYNYSKLISGLLRHGMPIEYILSTVKSLDFKVDSINSWKNGVMRALKSYITDGVTKELCSKCGSPLHRENGCVICKNCGDSKCG